MKKAVKLDATDNVMTCTSEIFSGEFVESAGIAGDTVQEEKLHAEFKKEFLDKVGAINCREIRSQNLRPCIGCVEESATISDKMLTA